jgi:hypothetical protein
MQVGWIWVKHGLAMGRAPAVRPPDRGDVARLRVSGRRRCRSHPYRRPRDEYDCTAPVIRSRATTPTACPSFTTVEHLGALVGSTLPRCTWRASAETRPGAAAARSGPGVERAAHLRTTERAVVEQAAVLWRRAPLGDALVDDVHAQLGQAVRVAFAGAVVATLDRVVEQAVDAVAVVAVVLRRVDAPGPRCCARSGGCGRWQLDVVPGSPSEAAADASGRCPTMMVNFRLFAG